jgi:uncharacterized protein (TIGR02270 family)
MTEANHQTPPPVLQQYAEESGFLWLLRDGAIADPHYSLSDLSQLDLRVDAHIDGLRIDGDLAWALCSEALKSQEAGEVFAAAVLSLRGTDGAKLMEVLDVASESHEAARGVIAALVGLVLQHMYVWHWRGSLCAVRLLRPKLKAHWQARRCR